MGETMQLVKPRKLGSVRETRLKTGAEFKAAITKK
jgi:hypothetical protein